MKKIPTIFERDWDGDRSRVLDIPAAGCEWVFAGEGVATRKYDGQAAAVRNGLLYRRHEVKVDKKTGQLKPIDWGEFEQIEVDATTGNVVGWMLVTASPADQWFVEALDSCGGQLEEGTCELVGPKVQANPEGYPEHRLIPHRLAEILDAPRTFAGLAEWLDGRDIEGIVWHHPDGRMAKIKGRDFGLRRA
jgi:hypothetical protein